LQRRAAERHGVFLDFLLDTLLSRDPDNFWDRDHIPANVADAIEQRIGEETRNSSGPQKPD
jgi:hypothetical protein